LNIQCTGDSIINSNLNSEKMVVMAAGGILIVYGIVILSTTLVIHYRNRHGLWQDLPQTDRREIEKLDLF
jgi:hypothetical protein